MVQQRMVYLVFFLTLIFQQSSAMVLITPRTIGDSPKTLPKGRFLLSYHFESVPINSEFNSQGQRSSYSQRFNRNISWNEIADADQSRSEQLKGLLLSKGVDPNSSAANYVGSMTGRTDVTVPVLGYGITDKVGVYVAVPIVRFQVRSTLKYRSTESARTFIKKLGETEQQNVADDFAVTLNDRVTDQLADAGYQYQESIDRSGMGDIQIHVPYVFDSTFALYSSMTLPTGQRESPSDLFGFGTGDQRWGLGARGVKTLIDSGRFTICTTGGVKVHLPVQQEMRVPRYEGDQLSTDIDQKTQIGMAFSYQIAADLKYQASRSFSSQFGIEHQLRFSESIKGNEYAAERYSLLEPERRQRLESFFLNVEYNSIRAFLDQDFPLPMQLMGGVAMPLMGEQTIASILGMVQVSLFF